MSYRQPHGGNGGYGKNQGPYAYPRQPPQAAPGVFTQMANNISSTMSEAGALSQVMNFAQAFNSHSAGYGQQLPGNTSGSQEAWSPKPPLSPASSGGQMVQPQVNTQELAQSLANCLHIMQSEAGDPGSSKVSQTVRQLSELASNSSGKRSEEELFNERLRQAPAFKELKTEVTTVSSSVAQLIDRAEATSSDMADVKNLLGRIANQVCPSNGGGGPAVGHGPAYDGHGPAGGGGHGPPAAGHTPGLAPLCSKDINHETHMELCKVLSVSPDRAGVAEIGERIESEDTISFSDWWKEICKKKSADQWKAKLVEKGATDPIVRNMTKPAMGVYLFQYLSTLGTITATRFHSDSPMPN